MTALLLEDEGEGDQKSPSRRGPLTHGELFLACDWVGEASQICPLFPFSLCVTVRLPWEGEQALLSVPVSHVPTSSRKPPFSFIPRACLFLGFQSPLYPP